MEDMEVRDMEGNEKVKRVRGEMEFAGLRGGLREMSVCVCVCVCESVKMEEDIRMTLV